MGLSIHKFFEILNTLLKFVKSVYLKYKKAIDL